MLQLNIYIKRKLFSSQFLLPVIFNRDSCNMRNNDPISQWRQALSSFLSLAFLLAWWHNIRHLIPYVHWEFTLILIFIAMLGGLIDNNESKGSRLSKERHKCNVLFASERRQWENTFPPNQNYSYQESEC